MPCNPSGNLYHTLKWFQTSLTLSFLKWKSTLFETIWNKIYFTQKPHKHVQKRCVSLLVIRQELLWLSLWKNLHSSQASTQGFRFKWAQLTTDNTLLNNARCELIKVFAVIQCTVNNKVFLFFNKNSKMLPHLVSIFSQKLSSIWTKGLKIKELHWISWALSTR